MGQIANEKSVINRANIRKLSDTSASGMANYVPAAGEYILISSDNSMTSTGQGNFDCYIKGDGTTAAKNLTLYYFADKKPTEGSGAPVSSDGVWQEIAMRPYQSVTPTALSGLRIANPVTQAGSETLYYIPIKNGQVVNILAVYTSGYLRSGITTEVPARFVEATTFSVVAASSGSGVVIQRTATSDGYFCVSFTTSALTSLLLYFEPDTIGINVYKMRPKVAEIDKKVPILLGKNLFDKTKITTGVYFNSGGTTSVNGNYAISDFIEIEDEQNYCITDSSGSSVGGSGYIVFYDSNKTKQSVIANTKTFTAPAGAKYVRFSIGYYTNKIDSVMLEKGSTRTEYEPFNIAGGYLGNCVTPKQLEISLADKLDFNSKNLFDESEIEENKCILGGSISSNNSYFISGYIPVKAGEDYTQSSIYSLDGSESAFAASTNVCMAFYNSDKQEISGQRITVYNHKTFTPPSNAYFVRITGQKDFFIKFQVEKGTERTEYIKYSPIAGYPVIIPAESIGLDELTEEVKENINATKPISFKGLRASATLAADGVMTLSPVHIIKNTMLSAKIYGTLSAVSVGVGHSDAQIARGYGAHWVTITPTEVKLYSYYDSAWSLVNTYTHGLTLTNKTVVEIDSVVEGNTATYTLRLFNDLGGMFTQVLSAWGQGKPFATNDGSTSLDIKLSFMPRDITKNVWCFGDSYFSFTLNNKWTYYAAQAGMTDWLSNNLPGLSPTSGYDDLLTLIETGYRPAYLVWCLGMNGGGDTESGGEYVINSGQKVVIDNVVSLCESYNITLVLATIPTVPERQKTGFCNYVKSLGVRYIDFAEAVGADSSGNWNEGLLSSDQVHPTVAGAKVLFSQAVIDFPELSIVE